MKTGDIFEVPCYLEKDYYEHEITKQNRETQETITEFHEAIDAINPVNAKEFLDDTFIPALKDISKRLPYMSEDTEFQLKRAAKDLASIAISAFGAIEKVSFILEDSLDTLFNSDN